MKKFTFLIIIIVLSVTLVGCNNKKIELSTDWKKQDMKDFKSTFEEFTKKRNRVLAPQEIDDFNDITPQNVFEETGCQIFKNRKNCESYLLYQEKLYELGTGFGGLGIVDVVTCDFDFNGKKELLYTYSWGSGIHRSCVGCFDLSQKSEQKVDTSSIQSLGFIQGELTFKKISDTQIEIYTSTVAVDNGDFTKLSFQKDKLFGEIKEVEKKPVLFKK